MKLLILCLLVASALAAPSTIPRFRRGHSRIVGGTDARPGQFPYQLSLQDTTFGNNIHFCGAIVYTPDTMITAGTCVDGENYYNPQNLRIVAGDYNLATDDGTEQARDVTLIILHEDFDYNYGWENDIALLKVGVPLTFDKYVSGVTLPAQGQIFTGNGIVSGWGTLSWWGEEKPDILQYVSLPIVSDDACRDSYGFDRIIDSMICAGAEDKAACEGDGGTPMTCGDYLCGIGSWGSVCGNPKYPGVYTEVSYFVDWILAHA
ncbi:hypothetical protein HAZT_HAZT009333 [Hyalella azteca]|uniref:Trypsin-1 n=1 Tax=Hyalella azteca TaxID=294128 RepID=A0A6A0H0K7_HYAAZ|nr:trypsin-1 [Hyalella azteca]KAA0194802.1 hypothetical protein HAZT_HAZT009333 [Hyalella azteca]